jgi:outer membrane immunogenic protein
MLVSVKRICIVLFVVCFGSCMVRAASATDLNAFSPLPPPPDRPAWAGFYFKPGAGSDTIPWSTAGPANGFSPSTAATAPVNDNFGYNFQSGNFVFGLEGSLAAANFDGRFTAPYLPAAGAWTPNMNWLGTVTGRVGYSFGQWLPYVKGGFAAAEVGTPLPAGPSGAFSQTSEVGGWTAGVGLEYQFSPKWSLGLEYLYTDFSNGAANGAPNTIGGLPVAGSPEMYSTALKTQSLWGRLNYKAGW